MLILSEGHLEETKNKWQRKSSVIVVGVKGTNQLAFASQTQF